MNFQELISEETYEFFPTIADRGEELFEAFYSAIGVWATLYTPVDTLNDNTIISSFIAKHKPTLKRKRLVQTLTSWGKSIPSVFEITEINQTDKLIVATDLFTEASYTIKMDSVEHCHIGGLIMGSLLPYFGYHIFLMKILFLQVINKLEVELLISLYRLKANSLVDNYPFLLKHILEIEYAKDGQHDMKIEMVSQGIIELMINSEYDPLLANVALSTWENYSSKTKPIIDDPNHFVTAIEFLVLDAFMELDYISQKEFAKDASIPLHTFQALYADILTFFYADELMMSDLHDPTDTTEDIDINLPENKQVIHIADFLNPKKQ